MALGLVKEGAGAAETMSSGSRLSEAGTLKLTVTDDFGNTATADIQLENIAIYGLEKLKLLQLQVDKETDLLKDITLAEGLVLSRVLLEPAEGGSIEIADPSHFVPELP